MEFGQAANRPSPILAQVTFCVRAVFTPVLAKHSKSFSLVDAISVGVDRMQRNFEAMRKTARALAPIELTGVTAKMTLTRRSSKAN
jgi:hypothetical protein